MHTATVVDLPDGDLIDCHDFARAIARFRYPVPEEGATGMACISATKMVDYSIRARPGPSQLDLPRKARLLEPRQSEPELDFSGEQFDPAAHAIPCPPLTAEIQLSIPVPGMTSELSFPVALTEENKAFLEALLHVLPPLRYPLSREARELFLAAFREKMESLRLVGAQCWEPILVPDRDEPELMALGERFANGLIDIVDEAGRHVDTFDTRLGRGYYFLSRSQAISVLQARGFPYSDGRADVFPVDGQPSSEADAALEEAEPRKKWTPERARKMHCEYMRNADQAKEVAKNNGIGLQRMYQVFAEHGLPKKSSSGRKRSEKQPKRKGKDSQSVSLESVAGSWRRSGG
ncbi:hypothetical protein [Burkholderia pseudomallei]|uniref:hypothetical protein n=1 Tax=Burkholderia pseudomallei TaxID=28450 RepID=UPI001AAEB579|nr:hypothetical protein [Burkholderia pseudomallei]MBO2953710.1 hypothetical protein [Burkholderia pseudomallei]